MLWQNDVMKSSMLENEVVKNGAVDYDAVEEWCGRKMIWWRMA